MLRSFSKIRIWRSQGPVRRSTRSALFRRFFALLFLLLTGQRFTFTYLPNLTRDLRSQSRCSAASCAGPGHVKLETSNLTLPRQLGLFTQGMPHAERSRPAEAQAFELASFRIIGSAEAPASRLGRIGFVCTKHPRPLSRWPRPARLAGNWLRFARLPLGRRGGGNWVCFA